MAPKNALKKETIESTSEGSANANIASDNRSTKAMIRSMTEAAASITLKQQVVAPTLQSRKTQNFGFNLPADGVDQIACLPNLKLKTLAIFNIKEVLPCGLEKFQTYINPVFQSISEEDDDYGSSDSSPTSSRDSLFSHVEVESSDTVIMPVMVTKAINLDEQLADMKATLDRLSKENAKKDAQIKRQSKQIADLTKKLGKRTYKAFNKCLSSEDSDKDSNHNKESDDEPNPKNDSMSIEQIQNLIADAVKTHLQGGSHRTHRYSKPYTKRIDALRMPQGFQPPKFHQFDGKGNPKQHIAHFIETCNNAGTSGDLLVKQFVRSLKGLAFDWYADLASTSIDSWGQMENEFLNRFYSTRRVVSISELTNTRQGDKEQVVDYIHRWRALSLKCKDHLPESSAVEMCAQGMEWDILYALQVNKPKTFQELATRAHDMELTIAYYGRQVDDGELMASSRNRGSMLRDSEKNEYSYSEYDAPKMLDKLLEKGLVQLPESRRPEEIGRTNDPNYCKYHRIVSHPIEKCKAFRGQVLQLANEGKVTLDEEDTEESD